MPVKTYQKDKPFTADSQKATPAKRPNLLAVLNKNPKYRYRWVVYEYMRQNGGIHPNGWRLLTNFSSSEEDIVKEHGLEGTRFLDGCIRRYEMALAFMPIEEWRELSARKEKDAQDQIASTRNKTKDTYFTEYERR